jgi:hypothetical protein
MTVLALPFLIIMPYIDKKLSIICHISHEYNLFFLILSKNLCPNECFCWNAKLQLFSFPLSTKFDLKKDPENRAIPSGVNFSNILQATFVCADPKSKKDTHDLTVFLVLLGPWACKSCT